jgi:hypothetical protein
MNEKINLIKSIIQPTLTYAKKEVKKAYKELGDAMNLPDDPSLGQDVFGDGVLNENRQCLLNAVRHPDDPDTLIIRKMRYHKPGEGISPQD